MIDQNFCNSLEYEITKVLATSADEELKGLWCDGVLLPLNENEYSSKYVNDNRKIVLSAFIGLTGQDKYEVTLLLGKTALSKYANGLDIFELIQKAHNNFWFDIAKYKLVIKLD